MKFAVARNSHREARMLSADAREAANDEPDLTPEDVDAEVRRLERLDAERARIHSPEYRAWQSEMRDLQRDGWLR